MNFPIPTPAQALKRFELADHIYLIGALERGVTIYNQQVRAHNFVWALRCHRVAELNQVAVVGGGITGLTVAACMLSAFPSTKIVLFERRWDLGPLQQGADHRWVHPHIYDWPVEGSEQPSARIPLLSWKAASASVVLSQVLDGFRKCTEAFGRDRLKVYLGVEHLQILNGAQRTIEWTGRGSVERDGFYTVDKALGMRQDFDEIVLTSGFGLEGAPPGLSDMSYWRNEARGQPHLDGRVETFVVSGYGDGAIVDLCRLTIERFRQDKLLDELFTRNREEVRKAMLSHCRKLKNDNPFDLFASGSHSMLAEAEQQLQRRIRKDTKVYMHLSGKGERNTLLAQAFGPGSSFLNRLTLYLLYRCGAFVPAFGSLEELIKRTHVPLSNVVCRHGADPVRHLESLFADSTRFRKRAATLRKKQQQKPELWFDPGFFRLP